MLFVLSQMLFSGLMTMLLGVSGCVFGPSNSVEGSGVSKTEMRDVPAFTQIQSGGTADVTVTIGDKQSLEITADDNILPLLDTEVKGEKLIIGSHDSYSPKTDIKINITVKSLTGASVGGTGAMKISGVDTKDFTAHVSGTGNMTVQGNTGSLKATVSGTGGMDTTKLAAGDVDVRVSGTGDAKVNATKSILAHASGTGDVRYTGNPSQVEEHVSGTGSVKKM
jgi:hypothetical protein